MLLVIDNYDSFVHNLARYLRRLYEPVEVVRNDQIDIAQIESLTPRAVILSPGPCTPNEAGICLPLVRTLVDSTPILGICLGHQAIAVALGGALQRSRPVHGRAVAVTHAGTALFRQVPSPFPAARYHSLSVAAESLPDTLEVTAWSVDQAVMATEHRDRPVVGLQFHPESILTPHGYQLLANFLELAGVPVAGAPERCWRHERFAPPPTRRTPPITPIPY